MGEEANCTWRTRLAGGARGISSSLSRDLHRVWTTDGAELSSAGGTWGMGLSHGSGVAERCSGDGDEGMGSMDLARHSASIWSSRPVLSYVLASCRLRFAAGRDEEEVRCGCILFLTSVSDGAVQPSSPVPGPEPRW